MAETCFLKKKPFAGFRRDDFTTGQLFNVFFLSKWKIATCWGGNGTRLHLPACFCRLGHNEHGKGLRTVSAAGIHWGARMEAVANFGSQLLRGWGVKIMLAQSTQKEIRSEAVPNKSCHWVLTNPDMPRISRDGPFGKLSLSLLKWDLWEGTWKISCDIRGEQKPTTIKRCGICS